MSYYKHNWLYCFVFGTLYWFVCNVNYIHQNIHQKAVSNRFWSEVNAFREQQQKLNKNKCFYSNLLRSLLNILYATDITDHNSKCLPLQLDPTPLVSLLCYIYTISTNSTMSTMFLYDTMKLKETNGLNTLQNCGDGQTFNVCHYFFWFVFKLEFVGLVVNLHFEVWCIKIKFQI